MTSIPTARLWMYSLAVEGIGLCAGIPLVRYSLATATQHPEQRTLLLLLLIANVTLLALLCSGAAASIAAAARCVRYAFTHLTRISARPNRV